MALLPPADVMFPATSMRQAVSELERRLEAMEAAAGTFTLLCGCSGNCACVPCPTCPQAGADADAVAAAPAPAVLFLVGRVEARIADADLVAKDSARRGPPGSPSEPSHSIDQGIAERSSRVNSGTTVFTRM